MQIEIPTKEQCYRMISKMGMMDHIDVAGLGHNSLDFLHRYAEVTKYAFWARLRWAGDPEVAVTVDGAQVSAVEPAVHEDLRRALGVLVVALHHARASNPNQAGLSWSRRSAVFVPDLHLGLR